MISLKKFRGRYMIILYILIVIFGFVTTLSIDALVFALVCTLVDKYL